MIHMRRQKEFAICTLDYHNEENNWFGIGLRDYGTTRPTTARIWAAALSA
jgi:hypothetical protein